MRTKLISLLIVASIILGNTPISAQTKAGDRHKNATSVAIVTYNDVATPEIDKLIKNIESSLSEQQGIRVLDQKTTNEILSYYLDHVDKTAREGETAFLIREARELYQQGNYTGASQKVEAAEAAIENGMARGGTNTFLSDLLILKAKLVYVQSSKNSVDGIYEKIVRLNPELTFPNGLYNKWEHKALDTAKKNLDRSSSIEITSDPKSSEIYVNGVHKGVTYYDKPYVINNFPSGNHCVELRTIHHETYAECFSLSNGGVKSINAKLKRVSIAKGKERVVVPPSRFKTAYEIATLVSGLGYYMGVDKVILVHGKTGEDEEKLAYQIGDSSLGAVNKPNSIKFDSKKGAPLALLTKEMRSEMERDVFSNPGDQLISQSVGSIQLHEKRRQPIYKRPVFWILVGAGAAAGGIAAVLLGAGAAAATTGGVIISL